MTELSNTQTTFQMVPAGYAEKAMASLMQLHSELMSEKEKRVDLFRQLMEREQALTELKAYVKQLEAGQKAVTTPVTPTEPVAAMQSAVRTEVAEQPKVAVKIERTADVKRAVPTMAVAGRRLEGWKVW